MHNRASDWVGRMAGAIAFVLALPILILALPLVLADSIWMDYKGGALRRAFLAKWTPEGKRALLVYSNSPNWQDYIETNWLPRLGHQVVILNWSERQNWDRDHFLEASVFRAYTGRKEFNPVAIVFRPGANVGLASRWRALLHGDLIGALLRGSHHGVTVVPFWQAFKDFKHGREQTLRRAEQRMFAALESSGA